MENGSARVLRNSREDPKFGQNNRRQTLLDPCCPYWERFWHCMPHSSAAIFESCSYLVSSKGRLKVPIAIDLTVGLK